MKRLPLDVYPVEEMRKFERMIIAPKCVREALVEGDSWSQFPPLTAKSLKTVSVLASEMVKVQCTLDQFWDLPGGISGV